MNRYLTRFFCCHIKNIANLEVNLPAIISVKLSEDLINEDPCLVLREHCLVHLHHLPLAQGATRVVLYEPANNQVILMKS